MHGKIDKTMRNRATKSLCGAGLDGNTRFPSVSAALGAAFRALGTRGIEAADVVSADMLLGDKGSRTVGLALTNTADPMSPAAIENSFLAFTWTRLESGFEVVAYLS